MFTRDVSQLLLSKIGGNVDHDIKSVLLELIDNSLDAGATYISIMEETEKSNRYLIICDNGIGIENMTNILTAETGKNNKKGQKNQGFLDVVAFLTNICGEIDIITKYNGKFARLNIDLTEMNKEYNNQIKLNNIDYKKCDKIFLENIGDFNHKHTFEYLESQSKIFEQIKEGGTYIKMQLDKDFKIKDDINPLYFQYCYNDNFKLNFMGNEINICNCEENNILQSKDHIPAILNYYSSNLDNGSSIHKYTNNFEEEDVFNKKSSKQCKINKKEYDKNLSDYETKETLIATLQFSLISSDKAKFQKDTIFKIDSIETLRGLWINFEGKTLGPFPYPIKHFKDLRNVLEIRVLLTIYDSIFLKDILMTKKSATNLDNLDKNIVLFIEYCKNYFSIKYDSDLGKRFSNIKQEGKSTPGIPNMILHLKETFKSKTNTKPFKSSKHKRVTTSEHKEAVASTATEAVASTATEAVASTATEAVASTATEAATYQPWKFAVYFGIMNCDRTNGISLKDNYITCKYGITKDDPNHRDSGSNLGPTWRRILYTNINEKGQKPKDGKYIIEWKLYKEIKSIEKEYNIKWKSGSKECFECPKDTFHIIRQKISEICNEYEGIW